MDSLLWILVPLILIFLFKPWSRKNLPPGPYPWPIIGNMMSMLSVAPHVELMKLARVHGPLMLVKFGVQPVIIASTQESAMEILRNHDRSFSGRFVPHSLRMKEHIKHSVVWTDCTDIWKNLRRIARTELFSTKMLDAHIHVRQQKVTDMVDFIRSKQGGPMTITEVVFGTLLNILGHVVFSKDVFQYGYKGDKVGMQKLIRDMLYIAASPNLADFYPILGGIDPHGLLRACEARLNDVIELWKDTVKERRANRDPSKHDFLEVLLANDFDDGQINAMFLETFGPGSETSSTTIEWAMAELLKHPDKMIKLRDELDREVGPTIVTEAHLPRLPYLHACIKETMRLHPAAPFLIPHRSVEACEVMGYNIPKDYQTLVNAYAIGRDPNSWSEPNTFSPERFLDSDLDYYGKHFQFIPFGAGRRICIGMPLASRTIPLFLGSLIHTFNWSLPDGMKPDDLELKEKLSLTLVINPSLVAVPKVRV
ncbi:corytuberine synthase-like [Magnolia sinica]|uniref:corytuberine synthase-like n=1 Tax=Magnolia sinica TaxID=86752 RepID=UPI00265A8D87|nr:corytuberine synthase-like [Magnolia sinica]